MKTVLLNYAGEYCEYCYACQAAVTVIRSSDAALNLCLEWLTMSYTISDSLLDFQCSFAVCTQTKAGSIASSRNTRVGTAPASCILASQYSQSA